LLVVVFCLKDVEDTAGL